MTAAHDPIGIALRVATAIEAVGVRKLLWFREGGSASEKQWRDVVSILRVSRSQLDVAYMLEWARRLGLEAEIARAQADAAP